MTEAATPLLRARGVSKFFPVRRGLLQRVQGYVRAVDSVDLDVGPGETVGLVGESGSGKSTFGRVVLRLLDPTAGTVAFDGRDITRLSDGELRPLRRRMQIVFQDPVSALNPRMTVRAMLAEPMRIHGLVTGASEEEGRVAKLLERVGLRPEHMRRYPHEFSGGQRQRIGIARALSVEPKFIVCDEPVSALDVSIQAQIVNLLRDLQDELGLAYLFIAHDLHVVEHMSRRVAVMYLGRVVELASRQALFEAPRHPYTEALFSAAPTPEAGKRRVRLILEGDVPSPLAPPSGCTFHPRCPKAEKGLCDTKVPELRAFGENHLAACHLAK